MCSHRSEIPNSHSGREETSASRFLYIENSRVKEKKKKKKSRLQICELSGNFLATSEHGDEFIIHNKSSLQ